MNYKLLFLTISLFTSRLAAEDTYYKAVCVVPIANLFGKGIHEKYPTLNAESIRELYTFTQSPINNSDCLRIHQMLFHEIGTVVERVGDEVRIIIDNVFYDNNLWDGKQSSYWTLEEYLVPLETINKKDLLPVQLDYKNLETFQPEKATIFTLTEPYKDTSKDLIYSVRTRFTILNQTEKSVSVACYNNHTNSIESVEIPKEYGVINRSLNEEEAAKNVCELLKKWSQKQKAFATLLGGCSGSAYVKPGKAEVQTYQCGEQINFKAYCNSGIQAPYSGFDCPGLIMSACQIFHIPFCAKNTTTAFRYLRPLDQSQDSLEIGDMIMVKGYLGMIVDLEKGLIAEARGNTFHEGTIRVTHLRNTFLGINTYKELLSKYFAKDSLTLIDKQGAGILTMPFTILKFKSIFDYNAWVQPKNLF